MVFNKQDGLNETRGLDRRAEWRGKEKSVRRGRQGGTGLMGNTLTSRSIRAVAQGLTV